MRKSLFLVLGMILVTGILIAQDHSNTIEKKAGDEITISTDVRIGMEVLKAGKYRINCDREKVSFTRVSDGKKVLEVPCKGKEMTGKAEATEVHTAVDAAGVRFIEKLFVRGSNVEHIFN